MIRPKHFLSIATAIALLLSAVLHPVPGRCEFPIDTIANSSFGGNFFQPSGLLDGTVFHLTFIGSADGNPPYKVYYCPIDGAADFSDETLTGDSLRLKDLSLVDLGIPAYADGRSPWIFLLSEGGVDRVGISFIGDSTIYFALINPNLDSDTLPPAVLSVQAVPINPAANVTALSSASDGSGNVHFIYADSGAVYYASTPFDDFTNPVDNIQLDSTAAATQLVVKTDAEGNAHGVWTADDGTGKSIGYYAMADPDSTAVPGKVLIPKVRIFGQEADSFTAPWISVSTSSTIYLSSIDSPDPEVAGTIYLASINPSLAPQDGTDLVDPDEIFSGVPTPLGFEFSNPVIVSDTEDRVHISGTGGGGTGLTFATAQFLEEQFSILQSQKPVSLIDAPEPLDPLDRSALAYFSSGKAVIAWSGLDTVSGANHIFAISTPAPAFPPQPQDESGCSIRGERPDGRGGPLTMLIIFAPATFFVLSRRIRRVV